MPRAKHASAPKGEEPRAESEAPPAPGAFWSGTISFGLVSVPVRLYPLHRNEPTALRLLAPDGTPVARRYYCEQDGKPVEGDHLVRGFETEPGRHVIVSDEELQRLAPEKTRDIELQRFVDVASLDPLRFERPYVLAPGGSATKAYRLLAAVMERTGRAGLATFVMNGKERIVAIFAEKGVLHAETLRYSDEVRTPEQLGLPEPVKVERDDVAAFEKIITAHAKPDLAEREMADRRVAALLSLVERKHERGDEVTAPERPDEDAEPVDLIQVLQRSLKKKSTGARSRAGRVRAKRP